MPDKNLTTSEAARRLNVSERRIVALIHSGDLSAEKFGKSWMVDASSVEDRHSSDHLKGRPPYNQKQLDLIRTYTLMNKNDRVLDFVFDHAKKQVVRIDPQDNVDSSPVGACKRPGKPSADRMTSWIADRYIPKNRIGLKEILANTGCSDPAELLFRTFGQNLTDQYWFKPEGADLDWHDINYFENDYVGNKDSEGPSSGTPGMLPKWWEKHDGRNYLIKGSGYREREPFAELLATKLYERLLEEDEFVSYSLLDRNGKPHSICENFINMNTQLVPMRELVACYDAPRYEPYDYRTYVQICENLSIADIRTKLAKMLVCDFLMANIDRHDMNLGLVRDSKTLEFVGVAPIFDNGRGFYFGAQREGDFGPTPYLHTSHPFSEYPTRQLAMVEDLTWFDATKLDDFDQDIIEVLSKNELLPSWFPEAAARQFAVQLARVVELQNELQH